MDDYVKQLDLVLASSGRKLLDSAGAVSHKQAIDKANSCNLANATLAKSRNYNDAPHIVASMGAWNHVWEVEVTTGDKPIQTGIKYNLLTTDAEYDAWLDGVNG